MNNQQIIYNDILLQETNQKIWDKVYASYQDGINMPGLRYPNEHLARFLLYYKSKRGIAKNQKIRILELGFGCITQMVMMSELGFLADGLEVSEETVKRAKDAIKEKKLEEVLRVAIYNGPEIPFEENSFDIIVGLQSVYYNLDQEKFSSECFRVLKDSGVIFFSFFTPRHGYMNYIKGKPGNIVEFTQNHPNPQLAGLKLFLFSGREQFEEIFGKFFKIDVCLEEYDLLELYQSWFFLRGQKLKYNSKQKDIFIHPQPAKLKKRLIQPKQKIDLGVALENNMNILNKNISSSLFSHVLKCLPNEYILRFLSRRKGRQEYKKSIDLGSGIERDTYRLTNYSLNGLEINFQKLDNLIAMNDFGYVAFGVTYDNAIISQAKELLLLKAPSKNINLCHWDGTTLPFSDSSFDSLVSINAYYQPNQKQFIRECSRILRPNGEIFFFYLSPYHGNIKYIEKIGQDLYRFTKKHPNTTLRGLVFFLCSKQKLKKLWFCLSNLKVGVCEYDTDVVFNSFFVVYGKKLVFK